MAATTPLPCGERAFLLELPCLDAVLALDARVRAAASTQPWGAGVCDIVPAARTLLVSTRSPATLDAVRSAVLALAEGLTDADVAAASAATSTRGGDVVEVPVVYDGPDLAEVAALTGLTPAQVVAAHTGTTWRVGFGGFAPGFAYLVDGDPRLEVPRRAVPRTKVPSGAVGLAGPYSGVYPRPSPGGWQLLGHTDLPMWDAARTPPALLRPGLRVRFVEVPAMPFDKLRDRATEPFDKLRDRVAEPVEAPPAEPVEAGPALEVLRPGPLTLVQDLGRPGWKHVGVGAAGPADTAAHALANRLVGNPPDAATLEVTLGGLVVRATASVCVAVTGAPAPATVNGRAHAHPSRLYLVAGDELALGLPPSGLRTYLAVGGGVLAPKTLGARATDTMSRLGPAPLVAGDVVRIGPPVAIPSLPGHEPVPPDLDGPVTLDIIPGPRADWTAGLDDLAATSWTASPACDRVGVRLEGRPLRRAERYAEKELPSEGVMRGAVQVPPSGLPVLFLNDHPVTGGYPVIGVLTEASSDRLGQVRPGQEVWFHVSTGGTGRTGRDA